jgi:malonyl-CoA O-methyltransferase
MSSTAQNARPVDATALARHRRRLHAAAAAPWLPAEVARRMAERLGILRQPPRTVLDWGAFVGGSQEALRAVLPQARVQAVEPEGPRLVAAPSWWRAPFRRPAAAWLPGAVPEGAAELLWSNMTLHGAADPPAVLAAWHRALAVDGMLMFSTLGPGTLGSLNALYAEAGWGPAMAPLVDMHDLGDQLVQAGFADPVMDQETLTLTWADANAALAELRSLGGNAAHGRAEGLRTPRWRSQLEAALEQRAGGGRVALAFEIVYGHAVRPVPRARVAPETVLPLDDLRRMVRRPPRE